MSFIKPSEYKTISDNLGTAFAAIRDAINDDDNLTSTDAYAAVQTALIAVASSADGSSLVSSTVDPIGSIMNDLGTTWQTSANAGFTPAKASSVAAGFFGSMLRKLNDHVKNRTINPITGQTHRTIQDWFATYAFNSGQADYSLFYNSNIAPDGSAPDGSGGSGAYFSQDFEDLCTALNITIPSEYKQSTYVV